MRTGSVRSLVVPDGRGVPEVSDAAVRVVPEPDSLPGGAGSTRRFRVEALEPGPATIRLGRTEWGILVRGEPRGLDQTRDDTDEGWGDGGSGHSRTWWEEQRPPHW